MDKSTANFFRASVNDRLLLIENEIVDIKKELSKISINLDKIIDFLQRKENNRGFLLGSYKTDFDEGDSY
jgi:hypothetical protein